jgi:hypothetical protein
LRFPRAGDTELLDLIDRYVNAGEGANRRYMKLLHGNVAGMRPPERAGFLHLLVEAAEQVTDHELGVLLDSEWRSRITAAWLIGVSRRDRFRERMGALLLESGLVFAGQGYCFALARLGTPEDAELLTAYLDHYLRRPDLRYDQDWALGALQHIDASLGTHHSARFTAPDGLWQQWSTANRADAVVQERWLDSLCSLVEEAVHACRVGRRGEDSR